MNARYSVIRDTIRESDGIIQRHEGNFVIWRCPTCPWYRVRTNTEDWEKKIIEHPNYGFVSNYNAYKRDIDSHDCRTTYDARMRHQITADRQFVRYVYSTARDKEKGYDVTE